MMLAIVAPLLIAVVGALIYALAANPKLTQLGLVLFGCGTLVLTFVLSREMIKL